jgi:hypothetical protein
MRMPSALRKVLLLIVQSTLSLCFRALPTVAELCLQINSDIPGRVGAAKCCREAVLTWLKPCC